MMHLPPSYKMPYPQTLQHPPKVPGIKERVRERETGGVTVREMASSSSSSTAVLLLTLNLLFFTLVSANSVPCEPPHKPKPKPSPKVPTIPKYPPYIPYPKCPRDTLKLAACGDLLGGLVNLVVGPGSSNCCGLLQGLADVDAAACLCTVIKANVLGINLNVPVSLSLLLNACGRVPPEGYQCA